MRYLRAAAFAMLAFVVLALGLAAIALYNQASLVQLVLRHIESRTGYRIVAADSGLRFGVHLNVMLDRPRILHDGRELARSDRVRVILSYHALIWSSGLPLRGIVVIRPHVRAPLSAGSIGLSSLPRADNAAVEAMAREFREFSGLIERLTIANATVVDAAGDKLLEDFSLTAVPRHRHSAIWQIGFIAPQIRTSLTGLQVSGRININTAAPGADQVISSGELWFWDARLNQPAARQLTVRGIAQGTVTLVLHATGALNGRAAIGIKNLGLVGPRLKKPMDFGDCSLNAIFAVSTERVALAGLEMKTKGTTVLKGDLALNDPYSDQAAIVAHLSGVRIDLAALEARLDLIKQPAKALAQLAQSAVSGQILVEEASYKTALKTAAWTPAALLGGLALTAQLKGVTVNLPQAMRLAPLSQLNMQLAYAQNRLALSQGSAALGRSSLREINGEASLKAGLRHVRYKLGLAGKIDLDEMYPAVLRLFPDIAAKAAGHMDRLTGNAGVRVTASGSLDPQTPTLPETYLAKIETNGFVVAVKSLPQAIKLIGGTATLTPGNIELNRVMATSTKPGAPGDVVVNGSFGLVASGLKLREVAVEMHQVQIGQWLPLLVDPADLAAQGPVGGTVSIVRKPADDKLRVNGKLTMGAGEIQLGFLRSPIMAASAALTLDGRGLRLSVPGAKLEGSPLNFSLRVADIDRPLMRIDATAARLDLEVMKFIQPPWAPATPSTFFAIRAVGHIRADEANMERLAMSHVDCDFDRKLDGNWRVYKFRAHTFGGSVNLEISGRGRDNWINIKGDLNGTQASSIFKLSNPDKDAPVVGKLNAKLNVWADADTDFFRTLAGTISVDVSNGLLHRFELMSRILNLVNLKSWLTARVPNPLINGLPFDSLTADFKGNKGDFYSDNLMLRGPLMNISARGHVRFQDSVVDMEVGLVPFQTVNWLMSQVPIIGSGLANNQLLMAYFRVSGPIDNASVMPMPIKSVAHFITNVIKLPINVISGVGGNGDNGGGANNGAEKGDGNGGAGAP